MRIRPATVGDAEAIESIRIRGWQAAYRDVFPPADLDAMAVDASTWQELLGSDWEQQCFVCEDDGRVLGWATISSPESGVGEVRGLYVDPDAWSRGAGRALMQEAEERLRRAYPQAILYVLEGNNRARRFYERCGWTEDDARGTFTRFGVDAPVVRYVKELSSSTSRS